METMNYMFDEETDLMELSADECDLRDDDMADMNEDRAERTRAYRRKQRARHIRRKANIVREIRNYTYVEQRGRLSKGKIHCSCSMCQKKRRTKGMIYSERKRISLEDLEMITQKSQRDRSMYFGIRW